MMRSWPSVLLANAFLLRRTITAAGSAETPSPPEAISVVTDNETISKSSDEDGGRDGFDASFKAKGGSAREGKCDGKTSTKVLSKVGPLVEKVLVKEDKKAKNDDPTKKIFKGFSKTANRGVTVEEVAGKNSVTLDGENKRKRRGIPPSRIEMRFPFMQRRDNEASFPNATVIDEPEDEGNSTDIRAAQSLKDKKGGKTKAKSVEIKLLVETIQTTRCKIDPKNNANQLTTT